MSPMLRLRRLAIVGPFFAARARGFPANAEFGDIVRGLPIPDASADAMYCSHVLEHLWRDECVIALANTCRHLKPGGVFRLVVPDVRRLAQAFLADAAPGAGLDFVGSLQMTLPQRPRGLKALARSALGHSQHRWMWEYQGLQQALRVAGFRDIREARLGDSALADLSRVENPDRYEYAVCIEAVR